MPIRPLTLVLLGTGLLSACHDPTEPDSTSAPPSPAPAFSIVDGARGGNSQFYFLPPMVPAPIYSGVFDPAQAPIVTICELAGTACGKTVVTLKGRDAITVDLTNQAYVANWKTQALVLDPPKIYRIQVWVGTRLLGYADAIVVKSADGNTIDRTKYVVVTKSLGLKIRFRIEGGATTPGWKTGDLITYPQADWGADPVSSVPAGLVAAKFATVYPTGVELGIPAPRFSGHSVVFTTGDAVLAFLPASGPMNSFDLDAVNPTTTAGGAMGGELLALRLNVDFSDAGITRGLTGKRFGDLSICAIDELYRLHGLTVRQYLSALNEQLGGFSGLYYAFQTLYPITAELNQAFAGGKPSQFAQDHLVDGPCPARWHQGDVIAYSQANWGSDPTTNLGSALLLTDFTVVYPFSAFEVGISGPTGWSMIFTGWQSLNHYLRDAYGPLGPLTGDLLDPTGGTGSGLFGGLVTALKLNIDFSKAGYLTGASGLALQDLRFCGFTTFTALNGLLVGDFVRDLEQILGGAYPYPWPYGLDELYAVLEQLDKAFEYGIPTAFAQLRLVNGACP